MTELENCLVYVTNRAAKRMSDAFNEYLVPLGITRVKFIALYYLGNHPGISQRELAIYMNIKSSTVARLIDRMESEGLVERVKADVDRRVSILNLSEKGMEIRDKLMPECEKISQVLAQGIPQEEMDVFHSVLDKMIDNVHKGK